LGAFAAGGAPSERVPPGKDDGAPAVFYPPAASGVSPICRGCDILDRDKFAEGRIVARQMTMRMVGKNLRNRGSRWYIDIFVFLL